MKRVLFILIFIISTSFISDDFCQGFEDGYCEGWKDVKGQYEVCPVAPVCPVPDVDNDTYRGGYNTGFKKGRQDAKNSE